MSVTYCIDTFRARVWRLGDEGIEVGHFEEFDELEDWLEGAVMLGYLADEEPVPKTYQEAATAWRVEGDRLRCYVGGVFQEFRGVERVAPAVELDGSEIPF